MTGAAAANFSSPRMKKGMSLLKTIDTDPSSAPRESAPLPERLISGNPAFKTIIICGSSEVVAGQALATV
ncbi:hypothetical protein OIE52_49380 [Streptomyces canus]|uniref:hypothetical protein n=1 Tax=Streptomyces canus TaxID=58343 RepID=UPI00324609E0